MLLCFTYILYKLNMGFLKFNKPSTNQSHIIYTDNVRRKSSFSILVSSVENANGVLGDLSKHIQTFEDNADSTEAPAKFITEDSGSVLVVTELGPNFVFQDEYVLLIEQSGEILFLLHDSDEPAPSSCKMSTLFFQLL